MINRWLNRLSFPRFAALVLGLTITAMTLTVIAVVRALEAGRGWLILLALGVASWLLVALIKKAVNR